MTTPRPKIITEDGDPVVHFDLDALEAEATGEPFTFRLGGEMFQLAPPETADWQVVDAMAENNAGLRAYVADLMSPEEYQRFSSHKLSSKNLTALLAAANQHYGTSAGKSRPSARSSRSTRRR